MSLENPDNDEFVFKVQNSLCCSLPRANNGYRNSQRVSQLANNSILIARLVVSVLIPSLIHPNAIMRVVLLPMIIQSRWYMYCMCMYHLTVKIPCLAPSFSVTPICIYASMDIIGASTITIRSIGARKI